MIKYLRSSLLILIIFGILAGFQYWAVNAREREWWWLDGGPDHMFFADLARASEGEGHLLLVERRPIDGAAIEYEIGWDCTDGSIKWGEGWSLDDEHEQIERMPVPSERRIQHRADGSAEERFIRLACDESRSLEMTFRLELDRSPISLAQQTYELVARGVAPWDALRRAHSGEGAER